MRRAAAAALCFLPLWTGPAHADPVADFYRGKTITVIIASNAGGSHSVYSQFAAQYLTRHIPGNPTIVVQHEGGAGGTKGANFLYNRSPRDGTHIGALLSDMPMAARLKLTGVKYETTEFQYLGGATKTRSLISVLKSSGIATLEDAMQREVVLGSSGKGSQTYTIPAAVNAVLGTKFKVITGYPGMGAVDQAFESGEVMGRAGVWASLKQNKGHLLAQGLITHLGVADLEPIPDLPGVPVIVDKVKDPQDRAVLAFIFGSGVLGRAWTAPPGLPPERLAALRAAFDKALNDPEAVAAAKARNVEWEPVGWQELQKAAAAVAAAEDSVVERARRIMEVEDKS